MDQKTTYYGFGKKFLKNCVSFHTPTEINLFWSGRDCLKHFLDLNKPFDCVNQSINLINRLQIKIRYQIPQNQTGV